jgi:succinoglycan biosynthesis transport protein ExoP
MTRECQVRICEGLGVQFPGPTRRIGAVIRDDGLDTKTGPTVTDTLNNPIITQLRTRYLETINKEANWSRKYGANHLAVVNLREQIRDIRGSILEELKRLRESYLSNYEIAQAGRAGA